MYPGLTLTAIVGYAKLRDFFQNGEPGWFGEMEIRMLEASIV